MELINNLIKKFAQSFYTLPFMFFCNILFVYLAFKYKLHVKVFKLLITYGIMAILLDLLALYRMATKGLVHYFQIGQWVEEICVFLFVQIEFAVFYLIFYNEYNPTIKRKIFKTAILFIAISSLIFGFIVFEEPFAQARIYIGYLAVAAGFLQLIPSFYYYYNLFASAPIVEDLSKVSSFWIITGITFLQATNIPIFLIEGYLSRFHPKVHYNLYSINYFAYSLLFILLSISVLCDKR